LLQSGNSVKKEDEVLPEIRNMRNVINKILGKFSFRYLISLYFDFLEDFSYRETNDKKMKALLRSGVFTSFCPGL